VGYNTYSQANTVPDKNGKKAYSGVASGSANLAPSNPALAERVKKDIAAFLKANPGIKKEQIPTDLMTSSGSGLDPHISPAAAKIQIPAIAKSTGISISELETLVAKHTEGRQLGIFGAPRVNVLKLNLEVAKRLK
jgi:K+-transporting ATPase ATPase C chain